MPQLPWEQIQALLLQLVAPALGTSLVVMLLVRLAGKEHLAHLAAGLALAAGVVAGNYLRKPMEWQLDAGRTLAWTDMRTVLGWSLESKPSAVDALPEAGKDQPPEPEPPPQPTPRYWLPWLAGLVIAVELLLSMPLVPAPVAWIARAFVAVLAGRLLTPPGMRIDMPAVSWLLALAMVLQWATVSALARQWKDGTVAIALSLCLGAASLVLLLQGGSERYMALATLFAAALVGPALIPLKWHGNTAAAAAAVVVFLPGLLLLGYHDAPSYHNAEIDLRPPLANFLLIGLAPLALAPLLLPVCITKPGWKHWLPGILLPLIPATLAVVSVLQTESLDF